MAKIVDFPAADARTWAAFVEFLEPVLSKSDIGPAGAEYVLAQVRLVYERYGIGRGLSIPMESEELRNICAKHVMAPIESYYTPRITWLLWELVLREVYLYRYSGGAKDARAGQNDSLRPPAELIEFPPKPTT